MKVSQFALSVAQKRLAPVDLPGFGSNQHEINGVKPLCAVLGTERRIISARFVYLSDDPDLQVEACANVTWYDARENNPMRSAEYRFYYGSQADLVMNCAKSGDSIFIFQLLDRSFMLVVCEEFSRAESMLKWALSVDNIGNKFIAYSTLIERPERYSSGISEIFARLGIFPHLQDGGLAGAVREAFPDLTVWPTGREVARFAWTYMPDVSGSDDPDEALVHWLDLEYRAFRLIEEDRIRRSVEEMHEDDDIVGRFLQLSLSVQNRRKSRAGRSLEYHFERILIENSVPFSAQAVTELKKTVDFMIPSAGAYHDLDFPKSELVSVACKTTLKDRWRQVLSESRRIDRPYLLTTDISISNDQLLEIRDSNVALVLPKAVRETYGSVGSLNTFSIAEFLELSTVTLAKRSGHYL